MTDLMNEANAQMLATSQVVQIWMSWMMFLFLGSVVFLKNHKAARYALAALLFAVPVAIVIFYFSKNIHLLGITHLIVWAPLLVYFLRSEMKSNEFNLRSPYGIWVSLLSLTISVSLVFDVRDIFLVMAGHK